MKEQRPVSEMGKLVRTNIERIPLEVLAQFEGVLSSHFVDVFGKIRLMDPAIHQLNTRKRAIVGNAVTVNSVPDSDYIVHIAFDLLQEGDILVINSHRETNYAQGGGLMASVAQHKGCRGIIVDGAWRDLEELDRLDFPVYGLQRQASVASRNTGFGEVNTSVACGGVVVNPGDLVVADEMGIVTVPQEYIEASLGLIQGRVRRDESCWMDLEAFWKMHEKRNKELAEKANLIFQ